MEKMYCDIVITATEIITIAKTENGVECKRNTDTQVISNAMEQGWLDWEKYPSFSREDPTDEVKDLLSECHWFLPGESEVEIIKFEVVDAKCEKNRNGCFYVFSNCSSRGISEGIRDSGIFCNNWCYLKFTSGDNYLSFELYYNVPDDAIEKNPEDSE